MRLALVIALAPDRRSGRVLSGLIPADQAISQVKQGINENECPDARFPVLQAVAVDSCLREHRFRVTQAEINEAIERLASTAAQGLIQSFISVEIGEGEQLVVINVNTEEEAKFLRGLASCVQANADEMIRLQKARADEVAAHEIAMAAKLEELEKSKGLVLEIGEQLALAKNEGSISRTTLEARDLELESCKAEVLKRDARIAELEAQMASTAKDPAPSPAPATPPAAAKKK
jgi:hypothetical protein